MHFYPFFSLLLCLAIHFVATKKSGKDMLSQWRFRFALCIMVPLVTTSLITSIQLELDKFSLRYFVYCSSLSFLLCVLYVAVFTRIKSPVSPKNTNAAPK